MSLSTAPEPAPVDRLSGLLQRFRVQAQLFHSGALCGLNHFDADEGYGYLHVLRRGTLDVSHPTGRGQVQRFLLNEPSLLLYPRPFTHRFHNPPAEGSDFTCARLAFDGGGDHPLARALPPFLLLPLARVPGLNGALNLLFDEADHVRCGQRLIADRLFEVVVLQLLRWMLDHTEEAGVQRGLIQALSEPRLARALVAMHAAPGEAWPLARMAEVAGMSRTAFAVAFKACMGQTPADYLAEWRLAEARNLLLDGWPLKRLAEHLGYAAPTALSRVFTAKVGLSPRAWLQAQAQQGLTSA
ncbi:MAG: hypothetical protein RI907_245 [Pseudomonadota bacterium]|jgi:AraC-like DNA-binding protein